MPGRGDCKQENHIVWNTEVLSRHALELAKGSSFFHHALGRPGLGREVPAGWALPGRTSAHRE